MNGVEFVTIFMSQLTGYESTYIASRCSVFIIAEYIGHECLPEIGDFPKVHVRVV
ncbi:hypothetical protein QOZ95_005271 [Paenibacillus brasilensis]|uniref:Uncharacterized protein n=1 Tax=Paenibacillus brasilensis TaxID=128574 RepID=A0ABU0L723_9BACL|nr:hypothetical protein [Paenibacillus brasilensis]